MILGIDASRFGHECSTGVEWYSYHIIRNLLRVIAQERMDIRVRLYVRRKLSDEELGDSYGFCEQRIIRQKRLWTQIGLAREILLHRPDIFFVPSHTLPLTSAKESFVMIHDVAFCHFRRAYGVFQYAYLWLSTKFAVKKAAKILVPSEATKKDLMNFFHCCEDKIAVVRHGFSSPSESISSRAVRSDQHDVEEILEQFHLKPHEKFFLFVGRLEAKKNLVRLLQAFAKFREKHPEFRLILAGKRGTCFREILKTFHDFKLERAVFMPGYITEPEKSVLFAACQGFVFPSLYEGFGLPVLESFYYEKPILASKSGSLPEVCGDACVMVDAENVHSIAEGLERLVSPEVVDLLPRGRDRLRQFDWKKTAKKTLDIFLRSLHTSH